MCGCRALETFIYASLTVEWKNTLPPSELKLSESNTLAYTIGGAHCRDGKEGSVKEGAGLPSGGKLMYLLPNADKNPVKLWIIHKIYT